MSVYVQTKDGLKKISGESVTSDKVVNALGYTPAKEKELTSHIKDVALHFDGSYYSLTNKPIENEENDRDIKIVDKDNNIILLVDENGVTTTQVKIIDDYVVTMRTLTKHIKDVTLHFDGSYYSLSNKPIENEDSDDDIKITDKDGNIILLVDKNGLATTKIKSNGDYVVTAPILDKHKKDITLHFDGDYNNLINQPIENDVDDSDIKIVDKDGNIILLIDENGVKTVNVMVGDQYVATKDMFSNYTTVEEFDSHTNDVSIHFDGDYNNLTNKPIDPEASDVDIKITDQYDNIILWINENGISTTNVLINGSHAATKTDLEGYTTVEQFNNLSTDLSDHKNYTSEQFNVMSTNLSDHKNDTSLHFDGDYNNLTNKPFEAEDIENSFKITDQYDNIILLVDANGIATTNITVNGQGVATTSDITELNTLISQNESAISALESKQSETAQNVSTLQTNYTTCTSNIAALQGYFTDGKANSALQDGNGNIITDTYATKNELTSYATVDSLSAYATVASLADYALKTDIPTTMTWTSITDKPSWITDNKPSYTTSEIIDESSGLMLNSLLTSFGSTVNSNTEEIENIKTNYATVSSLSGYTTTTQFSSLSTNLSDHISDTSVHFDGDYNSLDNQPMLTEGTDTVLKIVDQYNNIIALIDANGISTTNLILAGGYAITEGDLADYAKLTDLSNYATVSSLSAYATVDSLVNYALKTDIPTNISSFTNDTGYLTEVTNDMIVTALGGDSTTFKVADGNGNIIMYADAKGFYTTNVFVTGGQVATLNDLSNYAKLTDLEGINVDTSWSGITDKPSWIGDTKPTYTTAEIYDESAGTTLDKLLGDETATTYQTIYSLSCLTFNAIVDPSTGEITGVAATDIVACVNAYKNGELGGGSSGSSGDGLTDGGQLDSATILDFSCNFINSSVYKTYVKTEDVIACVKAYNNGELGGGSSGSSCSCPTFSFDGTTLSITD